MTMLNAGGVHSLSQLMAVDGTLENKDGVQHLIAQRLEDLSPLLGQLDTRSRDFQ